MRYFFIIFILFANSAIAQNNLLDLEKFQLNQLKDSVEIVDKKAHIAYLFSSVNLDSVGKYAAEAFDLANRLKYEKGIALALSPLSFYYFEKGNPYVAYKYINESIRLFRKLNKVDEATQQKLNLTRFTSMEGNSVQLNKLKKELKGEIAQMKIDSARIMAELHFGFFSLSELSLDQAQVFFRTVSEMQGKYPSQARNLLEQNTILTYSYQNNLITNEDFESSMLSFIKESESHSYDYIASLMYLNLGLYVKEDLEKKLFYFQKAKKIANHTGFESLEYGVLLNTSNLLEKHNLKNDVRREVQERMIAIAENRVKLNKEGGFDLKSLAEQTQTIQDQDLDLRAKQNWLIVLIVFVAVILIASYFIYSQYREKKKIINKLSIINAELHKKNNRLEENDEFHKKLISMLSHDLRQPFSMILMMSDEILENTSPEDIKAILKEIQNSADISLQTMDGLLNWMKLQILRTYPEYENIQLLGCLKNAIRYSEQLRNSKNVSINLLVDENIGVIGLSEILLFINRNIILNAINHSPQNGVVQISAEISVDKKTVLVKISDQGHGLPEKVLNSLFKKNSEIPLDSRAGAGISMLISHEMIQKMGGEIWAENNKNGGASFIYKAPYSEFLDK